MSFRRQGGACWNAHGGLLDGHCVFLLNKSLLGIGCPGSFFGRGLCFFDALSRILDGDYAFWMP